MKNIFLISLLFLGGVSLYSQERSVDSLKKLLSNTKEDTTRIMLLVEFINLYYLYNPDSSFKLAKEALVEAQRINYPRGEAYIRHSMSAMLLKIGDYSTAVFLVMPNIKLAESINDPYLLARSYASLATAYRDGGNYTEALPYSLKGTLTQEKFLDCIFCGFFHVITASIYYGMNKPDSALLYLERSHQYNYKKPFAGYSYLMNGMVHARMDHFDSAFHYFRLSFSVLAVCKPPTSALQKEASSRGMCRLRQSI